MQKEKDSFSFTYSAKEQEELKKIRQKYQPQEENKMDKLRKLDASVTQKATMVSLIVGIFGALIMGTGMSLIMTDFGSIFGFAEKMDIILGIILGMVGIVLLCFAYPIYHHMVKKEREKIAPEILRLTEELMK